MEVPLTVPKVFVSQGVMSFNMPKKRCCHHVPSKCATVPYGKYFTGDRIVARIHQEAVIPTLEGQ